MQNSYHFTQVVAMNSPDYPSDGLRKNQLVKSVMEWQYDLRICVCRAYPDKSKNQGSE